MSSQFLSKEKSNYNYCCNCLISVVMDGIEPFVLTFMTFSLKYSHSELLKANI